MNLRYRFRYRLPDDDGVPDGLTDGLLQENDVDFFELEASTDVILLETA